MKFLVPTAKEMTTPTEKSQISLNQKSQAIVNEITKFSPEQLEALYKIKPEPSQKEWQRWQDMATNTATTSPAIKLFNGLMYRNINLDTLNTTALDYLAEHVYITSSLYGIIPALDPIAPHRLDFNTKLKIGMQSLKQYWRADYDNFLSQQTEPVISLLSSEFEDVFSPQYRQNLISIKFMEERDGKLKTHSTISKKGRGQFINQACNAQCQTIDELKTLRWDNYSYQETLSSTHELVFVNKI